MKNSIVLAFTLAAIILTGTLPALAWDEAGHKITAYIAWQRMTPEVREKVIKILLAAPEDSQIATFYASYGSRTLASRQLEYFMVMATWPDIVRDKSFPVRSQNYHHGNWHYADTFWLYDKGKVVLVPDAEKNGLALDKLTEFDQVIRSNASDADKALAIVWLEHLVGDIHQPLHASAKTTSQNTKGDQGGNLFFLTPKGTPREKQENLHWFWDSIIGRNIPNTKDQCDTDYLDPIAQRIMAAYPYDKEKGKLADGNFEQWKKESFDIASTEVYKGVTFFETPSDKYKKKALEISEERMALAGYRMADLFNSAFAPAPVTPVVKLP